MERTGVPEERQRLLYLGRALTVWHRPYRGAHLFDCCCLPVVQPVTGREKSYDLVLCRLHVSVRVVHQPGMEGRYGRLEWLECH